MRRTRLTVASHATRSIHDPSEIYAELGSVTSGLASLEQVLRQLGEFHDDPTSTLG